ncbi:MAG: MFS transporter [Chloroflexota bacterium]
MLNASPERLGQLLVVISTVHLLGAFVVGRRVRVNGPYPVLATGMLLVAVGVFSAIAISSTLGLLLPMVLYALGEVSGNISAGDLVLRLGGGAGKAVGMVRLTSDLGMVLGPILAGVLADHYGVRAPFIAVGVMSSVAALMVLSLMLILRRRLRHS